MLRKLFRWVFAILGGLIGYEIYSLLNYFYVNVGDIAEKLPISELALQLISMLFTLVFGILFFSLAPEIVKRSIKAIKAFENEMKGLSSATILGGTIGTVIGLLVAYLLSSMYKGIFSQKSFYLILNIIVYATLAVVGLRLGSRRGAEIISSREFFGHRFQSQRPQSTDDQLMSYSSKDRKLPRIPKILDTSVIIDGRILEIMKTGFLEGPIVIPEFVLVELRHIADSPDALKRNRGRRGLDILNKIQEEYGIDIYNTDAEKGLRDIPEVDVKLLKLAQNMKGKVVTNDFNLDKVALIKGIGVLNINELANSLKPVVLPGEEMRVTLIKQGKDRNQGIGYLDDGTMIVVEDGRKLIGQEVDIIVTSVLQTAAGRMIFGKPNED